MFKHVCRTFGSMRWKDGSSVFCGNRPLMYQSRRSILLQNYNVEDNNYQFEREERYRLKNVNITQKLPREERWQYRRKMTFLQNNIKFPYHRPKHILEYYSTVALMRLLNMIPLRAALCLGCSIAFVLFHVFRFRVTKSIGRIEAVFGDRYSPQQRKNIAWLSLRNSVFNIVEMFRLRQFTLRKIMHQPLYSAGEEVLKFYRHNGPFILAVPHTGSWELGSAVLALSGIPCVVIVKRQKNLLTDALLNQLRRHVGVEIIYNDSSALKRVIQSTKQGKVLLILPDNHSRTESPKVEFLGGKANLGVGAAFFARKTGRPIYPIVLFRHGWNRHDCKLFDPIYPDQHLDKDADTQRMMQQLMTVFDKEIRQHPEQYFWYNKRWVLDPAWNTRRWK
ncbi:MAG: lysophospholipid acyltransferase family protein [Oryzomonas sp.]|uniref:lysophospholipid acyltransferase family protein n=1 Tax=Oryzomonas sp. TaxID=2855186 RepID=UPI00284AACED|nr:lysophospholipid acyltransferase family protein [Oryzomonas sp.]MDR3580683.1 lysophospholipid acyltransferase family protein [Oryzomonas sp.]